MTAAIDFDHTLWDSPNNQPMPGARDAINILREKGVKIVIHSCNNSEWIEKCLNDNDIRFDRIWEGYLRANSQPYGGKPVADIYIDDRGFHFTDWNPSSIMAILDMLNEGNPMVKR